MKTLTLAAAVLAAAPTSADASARFVAYVEGKQETTWQIPRHQDGVRDCKGAAFVSERGSETIRFRTRPARLRADRIGGGVTLNRSSLAGTGRITRALDETREYEPGPCGAPPPEQPPVRDCGTQPWNPEVRLRWVGNTVYIDADATDLRFAFCPIRSATDVLEGDFTEGVSRRYPVRDVFDRRQGLVEVLGRRTFTETLPFGGSTTTTITWKLRLRRAR